ncbi:hypothetical protein [Spiroplasma endosymbiont of Labia minor]|uniref:hypothetical protein n=1 Tax=Spiroplasma endosymbiont of Labia minor TaxID=3066305 RepID=UPI0030CB0BE9
MSEKKQNKTNPKNVMPNTYESLQNEMEIRVLEKWNKLFESAKSNKESMNADRFFTLWTSVYNLVHMVYFPSEVKNLKRFLDPEIFVNKYILEGRYIPWLQDIQETIENLKESFLFFLRDRRVDNLKTRWSRQFIWYMKENIDGMFSIYNMPNMIHGIYSTSKFLAINGEIELSWQILRWYLIKFQHIISNEIEQFEMLLDGYEDEKTKMMFIEQIWRIYVANSAFFLDSVDTKWKTSLRNEFIYEYGIFTSQYLELHYKASQESILLQRNWMSVSIASHEYFMNRIESYEPDINSPILRHYLIWTASEIIPALMEFPFQDDDITAMQFEVYYLTKLKDLSNDLDMVNDVFAQFNLYGGFRSNLFEIFNFVIKKDLRTLFRQPDTTNFISKNKSLKKALKELAYEKNQSLKSQKPLSFEGSIEVSTYSNELIKETDALENFDAVRNEQAHKGHFIPNSMISDIKDIISDVVTDFNSQILENPEKPATPIDLNQQVKLNINDKRDDVLINEMFWENEHKKFGDKLKEINLNKINQQKVEIIKDAQAQAMIDSAKARMAHLRGESFDSNQLSKQPGQIKLPSSLMNAEVIGFNRPLRKNFNSNEADLLSSAISDIKSDPIRHAGVQIQNVEGQFSDDSEKKSDMKNRLKEIKNRMKQNKKQNNEE